MQDPCARGRLVVVSRRDVLKYAAAVPALVGLSTLVATMNAAEAQAQPWMTEMLQQIGDVPLCRVALPGTHDSGTYPLTMQSPLDPHNGGARLRVVEAAKRVAQQRGITARPLILAWSQAQGVSINDQLRAGIR